MKDIFENIEKFIKDAERLGTMSGGTATILEKEIATIKSDIASYMETHFEIASVIGNEMRKDKFDSKVVEDRHEAQGTGGMYELAEELTEEFQKLNEGRLWNGEFFEEIDAFINKKLFGE